MLTLISPQAGYRDRVQVARWFDELIVAIVQA